MQERKYTSEDLKTMQAWPLERKIQVTQTRIMEWYQHYDGQVYVSFSGGKDSTVLLDLARRVYPDIEAVFVDTGLEYPEVKQFVETKDNVTILHPEMVFDEVVKKYGYPIISKSIAQCIRGAKPGNAMWKLLHGEYTRSDGKPSLYNCKKWAYVKDADFKVSEQCCDVMKKRPFKAYEKESKKIPITGVMATESLTRKKNWLKNGCNAFDGTRPQSKPMSFWTEQDVLEYLLKFNISYASVYGEIIKDENGKYHTTKCNRTGCVFCGFGCHREKEPNRFQRLKETHPKLYNYCINGGGYNEEGVWKPNKKGLGIGHVLDTINVQY